MKLSYRIWQSNDAYLYESEGKKISVFYGSLFGWLAEGLPGNRDQSVFDRLKHPLDSSNAQ